MEYPLEIAQQQADEAFERTDRLRNVFLEQGVQKYVEAILDEHRKQREVRGGAGAPEGDRENQDS